MNGLFLLYNSLEHLDTATEESKVVCCMNLNQLAGRCVADRSETSFDFLECAIVKSRFTITSNRAILDRHLHPKLMLLHHLFLLYVMLIYDRLFVKYLTNL